MRVLWTHNFDPNVAGKGNFLKAAAAGLRARGVQLQIEYLGNLRSVSQMARARKRLRALARDFDLIHAQFGSACSLASAGVRGVPKIVTLRGSDWATYKLVPRWLRVHNRLASALTRWALPSYDCAIAVSRRMASEIVAARPGMKVVVMPSAIDLVVFRPSDRALAREQLGFSGCAEKWIMFNSLDLNNPIKRYDLAKEAFEIAKRRIGNLRLRLATDMPHEKLPVFIAACDLVLCTSEAEGWPNSVKEALACDVPFVATDVSDLRDIARQDTSCRVCPDDPSVIADAIGEVLALPSAHGLRKHVAHMGVPETTELLISTYERMISTHRAEWSGPRDRH